MKIDLKQQEITAALMQYISKQGFALQGKTVTTNFTAGRKGKGLSVEIIIEDSGMIPGIDDVEVETPKPVLTIVPQAPVEVVAEETKAEPAPEAEVVTAPKSTTSLFS